MPAFKLIPVVRQGDSELTGDLHAIVTPPDDHFQTASQFQGRDDERWLDFKKGRQPINLDQPYDIERTYYDAFGNPYRTTRVGHINTQDFTIEHMNADGEWERFV